MISLLYHDVIAPGAPSTSGFQSPDANIYKFEEPEFKRHLEAIARTFRGKVARVDEPAAETPQIPTLLLTFDDGGASALCPVADLLEARGWHGHFFIPTDFVGQPGFLTRAQIRELRARGHVIGSHSCSHPARMSSLGKSDLEREWGDSLATLGDIVGEPIATASVPGGYYSRAVAEAAAISGVKVLFNSEPTASVNAVNGCRIVGRYSIQPGISEITAARIAAGAWPPRLRQYVYWNAKKVLKRAGGEHWIAFRKTILNWKSRTG